MYLYSLFRTRQKKDSSTQQQLVRYLQDCQDHHQWIHRKKKNRQLPTNLVGNFSIGKLPIKLLEGD